MELIRDLVFDDSMANLVFQEATSLCPNTLDSSKKVQYTWLSTDNIPYVFGKVYHPAKNITQYANITTLMKALDIYTGKYGLDSCLIAYYDNGGVSLSPHADDEAEIDQNAPIVVMSFGSPRVMEFCKKTTREQIGSMELSDCSIVVMKPGCQQELVHSVVPNPNNNGPEGSRISLSFRKLSKPKLLNATPIFKSTYASPASPTGSNIPQISTPFRPHNKAPRLLHNGYQEPISDTNYLQSPIPQQKSDVKIAPRHLVIGDSLVRRIELPDSITVCKGGAKPKDIINHIRLNRLKLPCNQSIETVTICCGTNSIGNPHIDMESIKSDYDMLIREIISLYPNAHIALFNIPPRSYSSPIVVSRIFEFNNFLFYISQSCYPNISFINLFREFLLPNGYMNKRFYSWDLLHFSLQGYDIVTRRISEFQRYGEYFS